MQYTDKARYFKDDSPNQSPPDIYQLFQFYNYHFFHGKLNTTVVKWSKKMTQCAGICKYEGPGQCIISLSEPLLKFRPNNDIKNTLLHEMIHAYLFLVEPRAACVDRGHGPRFLELMELINQESGLSISVYHSFYNEVDECRKHVWICDGVCRQKPPYYGIVKRSMNRPPQIADPWFKQHQEQCGGTFVKISEPDKVVKLEKKKAIKPELYSHHHFQLCDKNQYYGIKIFILIQQNNNQLIQPLRKLIEVLQEYNPQYSQLFENIFDTQFLNIQQFITQSKYCRKLKLKKVQKSHTFHIYKLVTASNSELPSQSLLELIQKEFSQE